MSTENINAALRPLFKAATGKNARWLETLLGSDDAATVFSALDGELFLLEKNIPPSVLITSAVRGEGRTSLAVLLAVFSAIQNKDRKILLVDADISGGGLADIFALVGKPGLGEFFHGQAEFSQCLHASVLPNLWITPLSRDKTGLAMLSLQAFQRFIDQARSKFDLVVVDGPAGGASKTVLSVANVVHTCVLVVRCGGPTREQIASLRSELERVGVNVLGCVLNQRKLVVPGILYGSS
jgi:Mrp family chromosome partitioning ATPase